MERVSTYMQFKAGEQAISSGQAKLLALQGQVSSGRRISTPSDDPVGAATAVVLTSGLARLGQLSSNQNQATYLLNQSESALSQFNNVLQAANAKLIAARGGINTDADRQAYASDLQGLLAQMVGLANSSDGLGGFLFAGSKQGAAPFSQTGNTVSFSGDSAVQKLEVSSNRYLPVRLPGEDLFLRIRTGNGTFTTAAAAANTGSGTIDPGAVYDPSQLTGSSYDISFNGTQYVVTRLSDNTQFTFAPASSGATTLQFDGLQVTVDGTPAAGDQFTVAPSTYQSIFDTMAQAIAALRTPTGSPAAGAQLASTLGGAAASLDQALNHMSTKQAEIGSSLSEVSGYQQMTTDQNFAQQSQLSAVQDVDYAAAISQLSATQTSVEAAIKSYSVVSKLSLFNYL